MKVNDKVKVRVTDKLSKIDRELLGTGTIVKLGTTTIHVAHTVRWENRETGLYYATSLELVSEQLPEAEEDFRLRKPNQQYRLTREQYNKLLNVIPDRFYSRLYNAFKQFNASNVDTQEHTVFGDRSMNLFVNKGLIHLEIGEYLHNLQFFKMDSHTNIVIHEVSL